ncbi:MAG: hypothetical protein ACREK9_03235, partial [Candidatus Rokuibacteriota bacterium]
MRRAVELTDRVGGQHAALSEPATEARERPIDFLARLVQDELLRRRDRLLEAIARFVDIARR